MARPRPGGAARRTIAIVGLAAALMVFPSLAYRLEFDDAIRIARGFPLPWNSPSLAVSLVRDVYLLPLLVDTVCHLLLARWLWARLENDVGCARRRLPAVVLAGAGALALAWVAMNLGFGVSTRFWYDLSGLRSVGVFPGLGF